MLSHDFKQNRSLCQILSFIQSYLPSDFAYFVKFADHYDCQLCTYERNRSCISSPPQKIYKKYIKIEEHFRQDFRMILQRIGGVIL